ncbi:unnamed protein product [Urochloa humidicola]
MAPPADLSTVMAKLEELGKKSDEINLKTDDTNRKIEEMQQSIDRLADEQGDIKLWKPTMESKVTELQNSVFDLKLKVDLFINELPKHSAAGEIKNETPAPADLGATASAEASGQIRHGDEPHHRSAGAGVVTTLVPTPVKGAKHHSELSPVPFRQLDAIVSHTPLRSTAFHHALPQLEFPKFDGTNPKIWVKRCETYFDVYSVPPETWVKLAIMNFTGSAAFWTQSIEADLRKCSWEMLCDSVVDRFERDQHNHVIHQFFHVKQSSSVSEYIELFDELIHQILAHDPYFSTDVITSRFVDGLKHEIKKVVLVHRPKDLDTASSLALLQEEVILGEPTKDWRKSDDNYASKQVTRPNAISTSARSPSSSSVEISKTSGSSRTKPPDDKMNALMAYRKAKGLCFKCGSKWGPQHQCPDTIPLHVVEELWQMFSEEEEVKHTIASDPHSDSEEDLMALSVHAVQGTSSNRTIKLEGFIGQHKTLLLVDSGNSHSFICEQFATLLPNWKALEKPVQVQVANGGILICTHELVDCRWMVQGIQFQTNFKILPLKCYDAIIEMNWLETFSPMKVHWGQKWLQFWYMGSKVKIQGLINQDNCPSISADQLKAMQHQDDIWCIVQLYAVEDTPAPGSVTIPPEVQQLVNQYADLFFCDNSSRGSTVGQSIC